MERKKTTYEELEQRVSSPSFRCSAWERKPLGALSSTEAQGFAIISNA